MLSLLPSNYYHIYNHAVGKEYLFREAENYRFFLEKYTKHIYPIAETYTYSLLPNHFHFLIKIRDEDSLIKAAFPKFKTLEKLLSEKYISKQFSNCFSSYTQAYNNRYKRMGSLFMKNFKRKPVLNDEYISKLIHYIHVNPVHHGLVTNIGDWHWSSYNTCLSTHSTKINRDEVLNWFGSKETFIRFHQQPVYLKTTDMFDD